MRCPSLHELPPPPPGRSGWPWTEASDPLPDRAPDGREWPRITVVTPSFNQARFVEATLRSVLLQGYPNLEYFVLDGGSSDRSPEIIKRYEPWLAGWVSEPDGGQSAAINRGLERGTGVFATWINSDDMLCAGGLAAHATQIGFERSVVYLGDCIYIDENDAVHQVHRARVRSLEELLRVATIWRAPEQRGHIVQPEVLFPRQLALNVGGLDEHNHRTMDYELWGKFLLAGALFEYTHVRFGMFRVHDEQKTGQGWMQTRSLILTALKLVEQARDLSDDVRQSIVDELHAYEHQYWNDTGPLARLGLPERVVLPLRDIHASVRRRAAGLVRRT